MDSRAARKSSGWYSRRPGSFTTRISLYFNLRASANNSSPISPTKEPMVNPPKAAASSFPLPTSLVISPCSRLPSCSRYRRTLKLMDLTGLADLVDNKSRHLLRASLKHGRGLGYHGRHNFLDSFPSVLHQDLLGKAELFGV